MESIHTKIKLLLPKEIILIVCVCMFKLLLHFLTNSTALGYEYFRDELYYIACSKHPALGYIDHPPGAPLLLSAIRFFMGDSIFIIRLLPALCGVSVILISMYITKKFGGSLFAQCLTGLALCYTPLFLVLDSFFSMNCFEVLFWTSILLLILLYIESKKNYFLIYIALIGALSFLFKHTIIILGGGIFFGIILTPIKKGIFVKKWFWLSLVASILICVPHFYWQILNHFPTLEFYKNATLYKNIPSSVFQIILSQIITLNPILFPLWFLGLIYFFKKKLNPDYRIFVWIYCFCILYLIITKSSRPDRIAGIYPILFAAGSVSFEEVIKLKRFSNTMRIISMSILMLSGSILLPLVLPILTPETTIRYTEKLNIIPQIEQGKQQTLPQYLADRIGWREITERVAVQFIKLDPQVRDSLILFANDYGLASAIDFYGKDFGLPNARSGHNTYYLWGNNNLRGSVVLSVGIAQKELQKYFKSVIPVDTIQCVLNTYYEIPICIAQDPKIPFSQLWLCLKKYI